MKIRQYLTVVCALATSASMLAGCDRGSGEGQKTMGHIEVAVGSLTGDDHLKRQGKKDEVVGGVKTAVGDITGAVKDATH